MIHVLAFIKVKPGRRDEFLQAFKANVPNVLAEDGCLGYVPTVDIDSGLSVQERDADTVTIVEAWESVEALHAHLKAPHMAAYKEATKDMVEGVGLRVVEPA